MNRPWLALLRQRLAAGLPQPQAGAEGWQRHAMAERGDFELPAGASVERDLGYGEAEAQRLDLYLPARAEAAPLVLMAHGGGWVRGDKALLRSVRNKVLHWVGRGWAFASANYRMLPEAEPVEQAGDLALALAWVQRNAQVWGSDPRRVVLMGHSAGAHLVSLLTADPAFAARHGAQPWCATVAIDGAAFDVERLMRRPHFPLFDRAFGADPAAWRAASPLHRLAGPLAAPLLAVCSAQRPESCAQAEAFVEKANALGGRAEVLAVDLSHGDANDLLGVPGEYTAAVDRFLRDAGLP